METSASIALSVALLAQGILLLFFVAPSVFDFSLRLHFLSLHQFFKLRFVRNRAAVLPVQSLVLSDLPCCHVREQCDWSVRSLLQSVSGVLRSCEHTMHSVSYKLPLLPGISELRCVSSGELFLQFRYPIFDWFRFLGLSLGLFLGGNRQSVLQVPRNLLILQWIWRNELHEMLSVIILPSVRPSDS